MSLSVLLVQHESQLPQLQIYSRCPAHLFHVYVVVHIRFTHYTGSKLHALSVLLLRHLRSRSAQVVLPLAAVRVGRKQVLAQHVHAPFLVRDAHHQRLKLNPSLKCRRTGGPAEEERRVQVREQAVVARARLTICACTVDVIKQEAAVVLILN